MMLGCKGSTLVIWHIAGKPHNWLNLIYAKLYYVPPFPGLLYSFFPIIESEILQQASWQVATEEPNKGL